MNHHKKRREDSLTSFPDSYVKCITKNIEKQV